MENARTMNYPQTNSMLVPLAEMTDLTNLKNWLDTNKNLVGNSILMPLIPETKKPKFCHQKKPWTEEDVTRFLKDEENKNHKNWGILLDRLCVVDADDEDAVNFVEKFLSYKSVNIKCPIQQTVKGRHYFFLRPSWADTVGYYDGARQGSEIKIDFKSICSTGTRGMITVSPSPGKSWVTGRALWEVDLVEIPQRLIEYIAVAKPHGPIYSNNQVDDKKPIVRSRINDEITKLLDLLSKTRWDRRDDWLKIAMALKNYAGEKYRNEWHIFSQISTSYNEAEADRQWDSICNPSYTGVKVTLGTIKKMAKEDDPHGYTTLRARYIDPIIMENWNEGDAGLARIAHFLLKDKVKKCNKDMYLYDEDEGRWIKGDIMLIHLPLSDALKSSLKDVETHFQIESGKPGLCEDDVRKLEDKKKKVSERIKYIRTSSGMTKVANESALLFADQNFQDKLDSVRNLIGVKNGVVDLRTGILRDRQPEDMISTVLSHIEFDLNLDTSKIESFALSIMAGKQHMADYLQKFMGYAITGEVCEQIIAIFNGDGGNGKGGVMQTTEKTIGPYYVEMNVAIICERQVSNIDAEKGKLLGARIASFNELDPNEKLKAAELKALSGGDGYIAKQLYKDPMTITPRFQCIISTNHLPVIGRVTPSIMRRIICIPFPVTFTELLPGEEPTPLRQQADPSIIEYLSTHLNEYFTWLVKGAMKWYANPNLKRDAPDEVKEASRAYFEEQDRIAQFLSTQCIIGPDRKTPTSEVVWSYNRWSEEMGYTKEDARSLAEMLKSKGFTKKVGKMPGSSKALNMYIGFSIIDGEDLSDEC